MGQVGPEGQQGHTGPWDHIKVFGFLFSGLQGPTARLGVGVGPSEL